MKKDLLVRPLIFFLSLLPFGIATAFGSDLYKKPNNVSHKTAQTFVFECPDGLVFTARIAEDEAWLFLPGKTEKLKAEPSASGAKYSHETTMLWNKGDESIVQVGDEVHKGCKNNRREAIWEDAKLRGVNFRARGNEPGWHLEISSGKEILFVTDYGNNRYSFTTPTPSIDQKTKTTTYSIENAGHALTVVIEGEKCNDTMSDETFEATVTVTLDDQLHLGCGRALH
jgi:uncharacterized membrane protein/membrane-bound inhibitor of C-type lysozyme